MLPICKYLKRKMSVKAKSPEDVIHKACRNNKTDEVIKLIKRKKKEIDAN